jgi:hypothetical protein
MVAADLGVGDIGLRWNASESAPPGSTMWLVRERRPSEQAWLTDTVPR